MGKYVIQVTAQKQFHSVVESKQNITSCCIGKTTRSRSHFSAEQGVMCLRRKIKPITNFSPIIIKEMGKDDFDHSIVFEYEKYCAVSIMERYE